MKLLIAGAGLFALTAGSAMAQDAGAPPPPPHGAPRPPMQPITRAGMQAMVAQRFAEVDADHDGSVTRAEFDDAMARHRDEHDADRRQHRDREFAKLDKDGSGSLSKSEFDTPPPPPGGEKGPGGPHGPGGHGGLMGMGPRWFDQADANHDGKVTLAEAQTAALARFDRLDANRDGTLTPDEMMKGMWAMRGKRGPGDDMAPPPPPEQ